MDDAEVVGLAAGWVLEGEGVVEELDGEVLEGAGGAV